MTEDRMPVAHIIRPHGIKGELVVRSLLPFPQQSFEVEPVFLCQGEHVVPTRIISYRPHGDRFLMRLREVEDRTEADRFRGHTIEVRRTDLPPLPPNTYYIDDLLNCKVFTKTGEEAGEIVDVMRTGGVDVLVIESESTTWMLPAAKEMLLQVDLSNGFIRVSIPEGLRDLNVD